MAIAYSEAKDAESQQTLLEKIARLQRDRREQYRLGNHHAAAEIEGDIKILEEQVKQMAMKDSKPKRHIHIHYHKDSGIGRTLARGKPTADALPFKKCKKDCACNDCKNA